jgi:hypothetical protein
MRLQAQVKKKKPMRNLLVACVGLQSHYSNYTAVLQRKFVRPKQSVRVEVIQHNNGSNYVASVYSFPHTAKSTKKYACRKLITLLSQA